jgi:hypothetical protein
VAALDFLCLVQLVQGLHEELALRIGSKRKAALDHSGFKLFARIFRQEMKHALLHFRELLS